MNPWSQLVLPTVAAVIPSTVSVRNRAGVSRKVKPPAAKKVPVPTGRRPKHKPGDRLGEWTLVEYHPGSTATGVKVYPRWMCECSCGTRRLVRTDNLNFGGSRSCGHVRFS